MQKYKHMCIVSVFSNIVSFRGQKSLGYTASEKVELCFRSIAQGPEELRVNK